MSKLGNTMALKKSVAFITGIVCIIAIVLPFTPIPLQSFFSRTVKAEVAQFVVSDFKAPEVTLHLEQGSFSQVIEDPSTASLLTDPVVLQGKSTKSISYQQSSPQFVLLQLTFSEPVKIYQSEPCFRVLADTTELYHLRCEYLDDTTMHSLVLPVGPLGIQSVDNFILETTLPDDISVELLSAYDDIAFLTSDTQLSLSVTDSHPVTVETNRGQFTWIDDHYVFDSFGIAKDELLSLEVTVTDNYQNQTVVTIPMYVPSNQISDARVQTTTETSGKFHLLISVPDSTAWEPLYLRVTEGEEFTTATDKVAGWYPMRRYGEPTSLLGPRNKVVLFDRFLREYPLIETQ